jgi:hypothetical protein
VDETSLKKQSSKHCSYDWNEIKQGIFWKRNTPVRHSVASRIQIEKDGKRMEFNLWILKRRWGGYCNLPGGNMKSIYLNLRKRKFDH